MAKDLLNAGWRARFFAGLAEAMINAFDPFRGYVLASGEQLCLEDVETAHGHRGVTSTLRQIDPCLHIDEIIAQGVSDIR